MVSPIESIRDFLTGGEEFAAKREKLAGLEYQRRNRRLSRKEEDDLRGLSLSLGRRLFVARGVTALITGLAVGKIGLDNLGNMPQPFHGVDPSPALAGTDPRSGVDTISVNGEAERIRQQIRQFEKENTNKLITKDTVRELVSLTSSLYEETFKKPPLPIDLQVLTSDEGRRLGYSESEVRVPNGRSIFIEGGKTTVNIYLGREDVNDPQLSRLSVLRGVVINEFIHAQTVLVPEQGLVKVGSEKFSAGNRIGFQWFIGFTGDLYKAFYFDSLNTQLLAQLLNDPQDQDQLFRKAANSPIYRTPFPHTMVEGARILQKIYNRLGIPIEEVEILRSSSQPEKLLSEIDARFAGYTETKVGLFRPASSVLINLSPRDKYSDAELKPLRDLLAVLPPIH